MLAILGLGALAVAGAVVDYWPVSSEIPRVGSVRGLAPAPPAMRRAASLAFPVTPAPTSAVRPRWRQQPIEPVATKAEYTVSSTTNGVLPAGELVAFTAPPSPSLRLLVAEEAPAVEVGLTALPMLRTSADAVPQALRAPTDERADGFLTGALKKTRESIVKTGAATGGSIVDAFRGVMGAFKKVSPFNDDATAFRSAGL